jgi:hypothetical protein
MGGRDQYFDLGDVLLSTAEKGQIRVNLGDVDTQKGYGVSTPVWGPDGYLAVPNDPKDGAARALYLTTGQGRRAIAFSDNRFAGQAGTMKPGDRRIVTDGPTRFYLTRSDKRIGFYTETENDPPVGGKGMLFDMSGKDGVIQLRAGGCSITLDAQKGTITLCAAGPSGAATLVLDPVNGIQLLSGIVNVDAPFVTLALNSDGSRPGKPGIDTVTVGAMGQSAVASPHCFAANM